MSYIENVYRQIEDAVAITNAFLDRLSSSGNLTNQTDVILKYKNYMPKESCEYFIDISGLRQICLSSCGVVFDNGKVYHYLCGEDIVPGDTVLVPVGDNGEEKLGTVVSVGNYYRDYLPYPYDKMKRIIGAVGKGGK